MWIEPLRAGHVRRAVRRVLRYPARGHAPARRRPFAGRFRALGRGAAGSPRRDDAATSQRGRTLFVSLACINCHTVRGTTANGVFGPDLTHLMSRVDARRRRGAEHAGEPARWIDNPHGVEAGRAHAGDEAVAEELNELDRVPVDPAVIERWMPRVSWSQTVARWARAGEAAAVAGGAPRLGHHRRSQAARDHVRRDRAWSSSSSAASRRP